MYREIGASPQQLTTALEVHTREKERDIRRGPIQDLAVKFLEFRNPLINTEEIKTQFFSGGDIFTDTVIEQLSRFKKRQKEGDLLLEGARDALNVARFYWDNDISEIPIRVVGPDSESLFDPEIKSLVYLGSTQTRKISAKKGITFTGEHKKSFLKRPDVLLNLGEISRYGSWMTTRSIFSLKGCDNLMLSGNLHEAYYGLDSVELSSEGECVIFSNTSLEKGYSKISLHVKGDIIQYPGSRVAAREISCNNYINDGGKMVNPNFSQGKVQVNCRGEFIGDLPDLRRFEIIDARTHDREENDKRKIAAARAEHGLPVEDQSTQAHNNERTVFPEALTKEELQKVFEKKYKPTTSILRKEIGGDVTNFQSYTIEAKAESYGRFVARYTAAGWELVEMTQIDKYMSVTLKKKISS